MIGKKISLVSVMPVEYVTSIIESELDSSGYLLSKRIIHGKIIDGDISGTINPPTGIADPFKSHVKGTVKDFNGGTRIDLKIRPGLIVIGVILCWSWVLLQACLSSDDFESRFNLSTGLFIGFIIPILLSRVKLSWDKRRLESRLKDKLTE